MRIEEVDLCLYLCPALHAWLNKHLPCRPMEHTLYEFQQNVQDCTFKKLYLLVLRNSKDWLYTSVHQSFELVHTVFEQSESILGFVCFVFCFFASSEVVRRAEKVPGQEPSFDFHLNCSVLNCQALHGMASEHDGRIVCPKTQESFHVDQAEKVYVM